MKIYIDITYYLMLPFVSGIQRVVWEVAKRLIVENATGDTAGGNDEKASWRKVERSIGNDSEKATGNDGGQGIEAVLLEYAQDDEEGDGDVFIILESEAALENKEHLQRGRIAVTDLEPGAVWLDMDSVWPVKPKRSTLYPKLRAQGVKIVPFLQDVLPITHPEYFAGKGDWTFLGYFYACMTYADRILTSAEATKQEILKLIRASGAKETPIDAVQLGGNLQSWKYEMANVDRDAVQFVEAHPMYALMVGTIEPRKNHRIVLDAFEKGGDAAGNASRGNRGGGLFADGIGLVFAGRCGWSSSEVIDRIRKLQKTEKNFAFLEGKNNDTIRYLYEHARVVLFPSLDEGYGLPIVEALTYGVPVIAGDRPVLREVGGDYCRYCDVNRADEWTEAIRKIFSKEKAEQAAYDAWKAQIAGFHATTWDTVTERVVLSLEKTSRND